MIYVKKYVDQGTNKKRHLGLTHLESFLLELDALKKIKGYPNMCQLIDYDVDNLTLHLEHAGPNLNYFIDKVTGHHKEKKRSLKQGLPAPKLLDISDLKLTRTDFIQQIDCIFDVFKNLNIVHFDLGPWNMCVNERQITVIDFGCVVLNGNVTSQNLEESYQQFLSTGGWDLQKENVISRIDLKLFKLL